MNRPVKWWTLYLKSKLLTKKFRAGTDSLGRVM